MISRMVWFVVIGSFQVTESEEKASAARCGYLNMALKYSQSCHVAYINNFAAELRNGMSKNKLLGELERTCRNYESYMTCAKTFAKRECPEEMSLLLEIVHWKWSLFCNDENPSDWLQKIIQGQYSYSKGCYYTFDKILNKCHSVGQRYNSTVVQMANLTEGVEYYKEYISGKFACTIVEILKVSDHVGQCVASWQDILLTNWLADSALFGLGYDIGGDEIKQLKEMRCNSERPRQLRDVLQKFRSL